MSDFNPYHKWLGIPLAEQPPDHYRLLGVASFESDLDVIEAAADRQMTYIRQCATGPYVKESQKILNELAAARLCLLHATKKADYDRDLTARTAAATASTAAPPQATAPVEAPSGQPPAAESTSYGKKSNTSALSDVAQQERWAKKMLDENNYDAAIPLLVSLSALEGLLFKDVAAWAKNELPGARQKQQVLRERIAGICGKARKLMESYNYAEVSEVLEEIPVAARTEEAKQLLSVATQRYEDCIELKRNIDAAVKSKQTEHLLPLVKRYLKLKPGNAKMQRLLTTLTERQEDRASREGKSQGKGFDIAGRLGAIKKIAWGVCAIVAIVLVAVFGVPYLRSLPSIGESASTSPSTTTDKLILPWNNPPPAAPRAASAPIAKLKIEIVKAEYGADGDQKDVTKILQRRVTDWPVISLPAPDYATAFGGDADPSRLKELRIQYKINDRPGAVAFVDNATILLPVPPPTPVKLVIIKGSYAAGQKFEDVTAILKMYAGDSPVISLPSAYYGLIFSDPAPGTPKKLTIQYSIDGRPEIVHLADNAVIDLPIPPINAENVARSVAGTRGTWLRGDDWLISNIGLNGQLKISTPPADEYTISMKITRLSGEHNLSICLPIPTSTQQVLVVIDAKSNTAISGLDAVGDRNIYNNATTRRGQLLPPDREVSVSCSVWKDGIVCECDGVRFVNWEAMEKLSLPGGARLPENKSLYFITMDSRFAIRNLKVAKNDSSTPRPSSGEALAEAKPTVPATKPAKTPTVATTSAPATEVIPSDDSDKWENADGVLVSPDDPMAFYTVFEQPPEEYSVTMHARRLAGDQTFAIGLPLPDGEGQVLLALDANRGTVSGLELVDGKRADQNTTTKKARVLFPNRDVQIVCVVKKGAIACWCGGTKVVDWRGNMSKLSVPTGWTVPDKEALYFATQKSRVEIRDIDISVDLNPKIAPVTPASGRGAKTGAKKPAKQ